MCCVRKCRNRRTSYGKQPSPGEPSTSAQQLTPSAQVVIPVAVQIPVAPPKLDARTVSATTPGDASSDIASSPPLVAAVACALE